MVISMLKIRRPLGRLIFNMGIAIPGKTVFLIETPPRRQAIVWSKGDILSSRPILRHCQVDLKKHISTKFCLKFKSFHSGNGTNEWMAFGDLGGYESVQHTQCMLLWSRSIISDLYLGYWIISACKIYVICWYAVNVPLKTFIPWIMYVYHV